MVTWSNLCLDCHGLLRVVGQSLISQLFWLCCCKFGTEYVKIDISSPHHIVLLIFSCTFCWLFMEMFRIPREGLWGPSWIIVILVVGETFHHSLQLLFASDFEFPIFKLFAS